MHRNGLPADAVIIGRHFPKIALTPSGEIWSGNRNKNLWIKMPGWTPEKELGMPEAERNPLEHRYGILDRNKKQHNRAFGWILAYAEGKIASPSEGLYSWPRFYDAKPETQAPLPRPTESTPEAETTPRPIDPAPVEQIPDIPGTTRLVGAFSWMIAFDRDRTPGVTRFASEAEARDKAREAALKMPGRTCYVVQIVDTCLHNPDVTWASQAQTLPPTPDPAPPTPPPNLPTTETPGPHNRLLGHFNGVLPDRNHS